MIISIIKYLFLFATGALLGWCLEVVFRRFFGKDRKWINPGFLSGPYLPLYGTGVTMLYIISEIEMPIYIRLIIFFILMTLIELVTGLFFLKYYNLRLWDYSKRRLNYKGIICPLFSFFWMLLGLFFYFILYPYFYSKITMIYQNLELSLFIGMFFGIFLVDLGSNLNLAKRIKKLGEIAEQKVPIHFENLKKEVLLRRNKLTENFKPHFFNPFKGINLQEYLPNIKIIGEHKNSENKNKNKDNIA